MFGVQPGFSLRKLFCFVIDAQEESAIVFVTGKDFQHSQ
jgi:hypothetical protein